MNKAFELRDVVKTFSGFKLGPLNMKLEAGTVMGYIGPNGSGKTTTIQCLINLLKRNNGDIEIFGNSVDDKSIEWKYDIGYVGDVHTFYENWSGGKNLQFISQFYPNWSEKRTAELASRFDINLEKKVNTLSTGNRAKLTLISVLARAPKLLLLDEPIFNLDVAVRSEVLDVLFEFMESGKNAVFYSTHNILDISRLVDKLVFLSNGKIHYEVYKDDLVNKWRKISFKLEETIDFKPPVMNHYNEGNMHQIISSDHESTLLDLNNYGVENIEESSMNLEEIAKYIIKGVKNVETT